MGSYYDFQERKVMVIRNFGIDYFEQNCFVIRSSILDMMDKNQDDCIDLARMNSLWPSNFGINDSSCFDFGLPIKTKQLIFVTFRFVHFDLYHRAQIGPFRSHVFVSVLLSFLIS